MWRDILIIIAFALAALTYFGVTPRRILGYTRTVRGKVAKRGLYQRIILLLTVLATLYFVCSIPYRLDKLSLDDILFVVQGLILIWIVFLKEIWKLSETANSRLRILLLSVWLPLFVASAALQDAPLWEKVAYPLGGFCLGFGIRWLEDYLRRKIEARRSSKQRE